MSGLSAVGVRIVTQRVRIVTNRCQDCYPGCQDRYPKCQDRYRAGAPSGEGQSTFAQVRHHGLSTTGLSHQWCGGRSDGVWRATSQRWWRSRTLESRYAVFDPFPSVPITTIGSSFRTKTKLIFETRVHLFPNYSQMMLQGAWSLFPVFQGQATWVGREIEHLPGQDRNRAFVNTGRAFVNHMVMSGLLPEMSGLSAPKCQGGQRNSSKLDTWSSHLRGSVRGGPEVGATKSARCSQL